MSNVARSMAPYMKDAMNFAMHNKCNVVNHICDKVAGSSGYGVKGLHRLTDCVAKKSMVDSECVSIAG